MPIMIEYFVDQDRYFYWIVLHIDFTVVFGIAILIVTESIFIYFITHACALFEIIGDRVERVLESSILNVLRGKTYLSIHGQLVAIIQLHQRVLKFIENLNTSMLTHYCILIAIGVVSLSMNLYILAKEMLLMKVTAELLTALLLVIAHFSYMGYSNYISQILLDKGDELFTKTYYAKWHEAPVPVQKMLLYIRQRSMDPAGLEFGGLYTGSLEFLSKLVNASMSYFTVLYSMT
ncbi:odorant receptor Or2-like isoform X2 [Andrena cerasifolii]|uniref:odorant receptor Or2-like isoform X2 n=1 Tax=Andrena cerasifolii TaxID=2819439 RepID=UPI004037E96D